MLRGRLLVAPSVREEARRLRTYEDPFPAFQRVSDLLEAEDVQPPRARSLRVALLLHRRRLRPQDAHDQHDAGLV
jgi:hypothetical protein